jgi:hypothetical protein
MASGSEPQNVGYVEDDAMNTALAAFLRGFTMKLCMLETTLTALTERIR